MIDEPVGKHVCISQNGKTCAIKNSSPKNPKPGIGFFIINLQF